MIRTITDFMREAFIILLELFFVAFFAGVLLLACAVYSGIIQ